MKKKTARLDPGQCCSEPQHPLKNKPIKDMALPPYDVNPN
jgi:hypothetical protein